METQGIKYTGSKREILSVLLELIKPLNVKTILDGFSGTTRVSQALKQAGYTVYANDIADWSKVFGECYLLNKKPASYYLPIIEHLNNLSGKYGWFSENYGGELNGGSATQKDDRKRIWQLHNTKKLAESEKLKDALEKVKIVMCSGSAREDENFMKKLEDYKNVIGIIEKGLEDIPGQLKKILEDAGVVMS